jgi:type III secretory pathway component EscU
VENLLFEFDPTAKKCFHASNAKRRGTATESVKQAEAHVFITLFLGFLLITKKHQHQKASKSLNYSAKTENRPSMTHIKALLQPRNSLELILLIDPIQAICGDMLHIIYFLSLTSQVSFSLMKEFFLLHGILLLYNLTHATGEVLKHRI